MLFHTCVAGHVEQQRLGVAAPQVFGKVGKHMRGRLAEMVEPLRVLRKGLPQVLLTCIRRKMGMQQGPLGGLVAAKGHGFSLGSGNAAEMVT
ncbi:hypothetical protein D3C87_1641230 [compost metagenome]